MYVANRVTKVQSLTNVKDWCHVSGEDNPADCASRGLLPSQLIDHLLWWNGPEFLTDKFFKIPTHDDFQSDIEIISLNTTECVIKDVSILPKVSSFYRLKRIIAFCLRFITSCRNKKRVSGPIMANELYYVELVILKTIQGESLGKEIESLRAGNCVHRSSKFIKLSPFLRMMTFYVLVLV